MAIQSASAMRVFRRCLRQVLCKKLVVCRGTPGVAAGLHRRALLDALCPVLPGDHASFVRRAVVEQCANGDYQRADRFEIYLDGEYNQAEVLYFVCRHFVGAVARLPPRIYPRSRWTGAGSFDLSARVAHEHELVVPGGVRLVRSDLQRHGL